MIQRIYNLVMLAAIAGLAYVGYLLVADPDWNGTEDIPKLAVAMLGCWFVFTLFNFLVYRRLSPILKHGSDNVKSDA